MRRALEVQCIDKDSSSKESDSAGGKSALNPQ